jgi:hypothetical protein
MVGFAAPISDLFSTLPLGLPGDLLPRAAVAYVHYLSFMVCFGALVLERRLIRPNPDRKDAITMFCSAGVKEGEMLESASPGESF